MSKTKKVAAPKKVAKPAAPKAPAAKADGPALAPGTVLKKLDRAGKTRCELTVEAGGYKYKSTVYSSLSAAAAAAAKDLGLSGTSFNGYVFWGLTKPGGDAVSRLEHLWQRYSNAAVQLASGPEKAATLE